MKNKILLSFLILLNSVVLKAFMKEDSISIGIKITIEESEMILKDKAYGRLAKNALNTLKGTKGFMNRNTGETVVFFSNGDIFKYTFKEFETLSDSLSIDYYKIPFDDTFLKSIEASIGDLSSQLGIKRDSLDGSIESLKLVDKAYLKLLKEELADGKLYKPMVAYYGFVIQKYTEGTWYIETKDGYQRVFIKAKDAKRYDVNSYIYSKIVNGTNLFSLEGKAKLDLGILPPLKLGDPPVIDIRNHKIE